MIFFYCSEAFSFCDSSLITISLFSSIQYRSHVSHDMTLLYLYPVQFSTVSHVQLFVTPWTAACQASLSITNSQRLLKLMSVELVMPSNHLILCRPLLLLTSIFPSIGDISYIVSCQLQVVTVFLLPSNLDDFYFFSLNHCFISFP